ncbi:MAG: hypothetical protein LBO74_15250 [Candidatus Symbiothrix sp.]|jgi:hypothetical protein|nr:hypothetical protein [Candidatus Symbiothrix sp.]
MMKKVLIYVAYFMTFAVTMQAQDNKLAELLSSAREAFDSGEYSKTLTIAAHIQGKQSNLH